LAGNVSQSVSAPMSGGGYVFNHCHNLQGEVPPENVLAMFDTAYECGFYE
jgi:uroporphyrinogen decarboxylase